MKTPTPAPHDEPSVSAPGKKLHPGQRPPNWIRPDGTPAPPTKLSTLAKVAIGIGALSWAAVVGFAVVLNSSGARKLEGTPSPNGPSSPTTSVASADGPSEPSIEPAQTPTALTASDAAPICEDAAREQITHPSTADFSILGIGFRAFDDGTAIFTTTFTAKNSFNLELEYQVACDFTGTTLTDITIVEAR